MKKKSSRPFPNNPKLPPLEKKMPYNLSIKKKLVLEFENICEEIGTDRNTMVSELLLTFIKNYR